MTPTQSNHGAPRIEVTPARSLVDQPIAVRLVGFPPGATVTLRSSLRDDAGRRWAAEGVFSVGADGSVDLAEAAPSAGTWATADPMGTIWSMRVDPSGDGLRATFGADLRPYPVEFAAEIDGRTVATARVERLPVEPAVTRTEVRARGLYGTLFMPAGAGPHPGVVVVGGSGGGLSEGSSALLASHGVAALALAYFGAGPLTPDLADIPLEYFETAIDWLLEQPGVHPERAGFMGTSRGGELSLLVGSWFPKIGAVVANVPSSVVHGGLVRNAQPDQTPRPAWTHRGEPVTAMPRAPHDPSIPPPKPPIPLTPAFLRGMANEAAVEAATIPVERIAGPVMLIAGEDDQMWPSAMFSRRVMDRLQRYHHPYPDVLLSYPGAGHLIGPPGLPATTTYSIHPLSGLNYAFGGDPPAVAAAQAASWPRVRRFFREALAPAPAAAGRPAD